MSMKAQADVISAVIIIIIAITLVSAAYMWGIPLIRKRQDTALVERAYKAFDRNNFNSLVRKIEYIYKNGGEDTFTLDINGVWTLYPCPSIEGGGCTCDSTSPCNAINNSLRFTFFSSTMSNIAVGKGWVPLSSPNIDPIGTVGVDDPSVVLARADKYGDGFNITYEIWFRELDESPTKGYKIGLVDPNPGGPVVKSSSGKSLRISRGAIRQISDGKILIITEMKIFLV